MKEFLQLRKEEELCKESQWDVDSNICSCLKPIFCKKKCKTCYNKEYHHKNRNKILTKKKSYYKDNRQKEISRSKKYRLDNLSKVKNSEKIYYRNNRDKIREKRKIWEQKQIKNRTLSYLKHILRSRLRQALKNSSKKGSAVNNLGCSIENFKLYLESKFQSGMSWSNYGKWHIDHIKPLSSFNLVNKRDLKLCCHYTNLQPLWAEDNMKKYNKIL
jgi:hypothetical protein